MMNPNYKSWYRDYAGALASRGPCSFYRCATLYLKRRIGVHCLTHLFLEVAHVAEVKVVA
jgi:hypothetical protein